MHERQVDIGRALSTGWNAFTQHPGPLVLGYLILLVLVTVGGLIPFLNVLFQMFVAPALTGGAILLFLKAAVRSRDAAAPAPEAGDIFQGFSNYLPWLGLYWLWALLTLLCWVPLGLGAVAFGLTQGSDAEPVGATFVVLGGIVSAVLMLVAALRWGLSYPLVADPTQSCGVLESFEKSAALTAGRRGSIFVAALVLSLVSFAGFLAFGIGVLITAPIAGASGMAVYLQLRDDASAPAPSPPPVA